MEAGAATELKSDSNVGALWAGLLVGPIAALTQQEVNYALVLWACARAQTWPLHLTSVVALLLTIVAGFLAYDYWRRLSADEDGGGPVARSRFMAIVGVSISLLMSLVIIAQWLSIVIHRPCER